VITQCVYCQTDLTEDQVTFDHIVPLARGGPDRRWNLAPCCEPCNRLKGPLTASEFLATRDDLDDLEALKRVVLASIPPKITPLPDLPPLPKKPRIPPPKPVVKTFTQTLAERHAAILRGGGCVAVDGFKCTCQRCTAREAERLKAETADRLKAQLAANAERFAIEQRQRQAEERRRQAKQEGRRAGQ
jgi:hypothetical protein